VVYYFVEIMGVDMLSRFSIVMERDVLEGGYTVTVPGLPGCITEGDTFDEALINAKEAIMGYFEALKKEGLPFPQDAPMLTFSEVGTTY
jgi:predicted RNase H-like HicB family nuclease